MRNNIQEQKVSPKHTQKGQIKLEQKRIDTTTFCEDLDEEALIC